ncbi:MAG: hypothetical protein LBL84_00690, partial [Candidatus Nomurabacteria bacterium]|nr:hypothetical protein [Candidatus Nomurabacteria bacterium]
MFTISKTPTATPLSAVAILKTTVPKLGETVYDTLKQQARLRGPMRLSLISKDYVYAPRAFKPEDVGRSLTLLGSVFDAYGKEVVDDCGEVIATRTGDSYSIKAEITNMLATKLSAASGDDIRAMCIEGHSALCTEAVAQDDIAIVKALGLTECVGTAVFKIIGFPQFAYGSLNFGGRKI